MYAYAQNNLQLFNQLKQENYSNDDLSCIAKTYQLVIRLFTGNFRASGKTFIAHLVGTASILVNLHASSTVIATGLLHAAYTHGDFGGLGKKGVSTAKRERVRRAVGQEIEGYIIRYTALKWNSRTIAAIYEQMEQWDQIDRDILLVRLANELEEYLDLGILYCGNTKEQMYKEHDSNSIVAMAEKLGYPSLAAELSRVFAETRSAKLSSELCNPTHQPFSSLVIPHSCQRKFPAWLYRMMFVVLKT